MITSVIDPAQCKNMSDVREGVDIVDNALVDLLVKRFAYMDAAARIKVTRDAVRNEERKAQVIENATAHAHQVGIPSTAIREMWEILVEASIGYELEQWDALHN